MAGSQLVDDELWELVKPLIPDHTPQRTGRPLPSPNRYDDRYEVQRRKNFREHPY